MNEFGELVIDVQFGRLVQRVLVAEIVQLLIVGGVQQIVVDDVFLADLHEHRVLNEHVLEHQTEHVAEQDDIGRDQFAKKFLIEAD